MNCKQDEIAIVLKGGNAIKEGMIVRCVEFLGDAHGVPGFFKDVWLVEFGGERRSPEGIPWGVPDEFLRPIRDPGDDEVDETLIYAGDPQIREAHA